MWQPRAAASSFGSSHVWTILLRARPTVFINALLAHIDSPRQWEETHRSGAFRVFHLCQANRLRSPRTIPLGFFCLFFVMSKKTCEFNQLPLIVMDPRKFVFLSNRSNQTYQLDLLLSFYSPTPHPNTCALFHDFGWFSPSRAPNHDGLMETCPRPASQLCPLSGSHVHGSLIDVA